MSDKNEIPKMPSVKTFDSNMSKKLNKNFETDFIQCLDSFAYLNLTF